MSYITVPSILHPTELAYKLTSDVLDSYRNRGERPLIDNIRAYHTYGDGTTQHSGDWATQWHDIEDVCLSFASAILADPKNPEWRHLDYPFEGHFKRADIEFAKTVIHKDDGKVRFFSMEEHKFTASDKRNDRRYERVEPRHDGSPAAVFAMIWKDYQCWLIRIRLAYEIAESC